MAGTDGSLKPSLDLRPADLVSRLLAATPAYLYTPLSNTFFFSEMLRSFVQARSSSSGGMRRGRKRGWREIRHQQNDKPLELTTNPKPPRTPPPKAESPPKAPTPNLLLPPMLSLPPSDAILPPPAAPLWYPPMNMYPPPPPPHFDPHFFVDLRVSGHIWDRKIEKESAEPLNLQTEDKKNVLNLSFRKHNSAFSVPQPREQQQHQDRSTEKSPVGTNYVLQNLHKIYKEVKTKQEKEEDVEKEKNEEELGPEEKKRRDIRALIGLELVKDFVKQEGVPEDRDDTEDSNDSSDSNQEPLVMD